MSKSSLDGLRSLGHGCMKYLLFFFSFYLLSLDYTTADGRNEQPREQSRAWG